MSGPGRRSAFGLAIDADFDLPGSWAPEATGDLPLRIVATTHEIVQAQFSCHSAAGWQGVSDGVRFEARIGDAGDLLMTHGTLAAWLAPLGGTLLVAGDVSSPTVLRPLLDSVLFTASLWHGRDALHAGAVVTAHGLVAVTGASGAGKSSLVAALLADGAEFFTDDILVLGDAGAFPGPPMMTVPDSSPLGGEMLARLAGERWIARRPVGGPVPLAGVVALEPEPREPWMVVLDGLLRFPSDEPSMTRRASVALKLAAAVPVLVIPPHAASPQNLARRVNESIRSGYANGPV